MRWHLPPRHVLVTSFLGLALLSFLFSVSDWRAFVRAVRLPLVTVGELAALMVVYLVAKWIVWLRLIRRAGIDVPAHDAFFAYLGGELTKSLPGGIYFQIYLLSLLSGHQVAVVVATSTVLVGLEAAVTMAILLVFGIRGWPWLRVLLLAIAMAWVLLFFLIWRFDVLGRLKPWAREQGIGWLTLVLEQATLFYQGIRSVWSPHLWLELFGLSALYLVAAGAQLYLIGLRLDPRALDFWTANSAHAFSLLLPLMTPIPIQIGFSELTGTGALMASGFPRGAAIALIFAFRLWNNGLPYVIALPVMLAMWPQVKRLLSHRHA